MEATELETTQQQSPISKLRSTMMYNIWLAGLGAYAKSGDEVSQLTSKGRNLFEELIERGREVEAQTQEKVHTMKSHTSVALEERLQRSVQRMLGVDVDFLDDLDVKLDKIAEQVDVLVEKKSGTTTASKAAAKPAVTRRKTTAKKTTATTAAAESKEAEKPAEAKDEKVADKSAES